uniref:LLGL scribble cell polarity complex component 2 n=1 Tax=Ictidomys tridecemlineatus TaxID=43179 RepID=I3MK09_ICTTR
MRRFLRPGHDPARERLKRDLFQFNKTVEHGFPHQPSALGYSPSLRILAIGTRSGAVKLYGAPGVEFMGLHRENNAVMQIHFLPGQVRADSGRGGLRAFSLPLYPYIFLKEWCVEGGMGRSLRLLGKHETTSLFLAGGFQATLRVAGGFWLPEEARHRRVFEMVEALQEHPRDPNQVLIGYSRGLVVIWDLQGSRVLCHFLSNQQLENVTWQRDGRLIVTCHSDGSHCQWPVSSQAQQPEPLRSSMPYGPFPCKAITKIFWLTTRQGLPFTIFQGGMPRASYGDRHCISVIHNGQQVAFDFTSRVIDFTVLAEVDPAAAFDDPYALVVLAEEELVVIDLRTAGWPSVQPPYLASLHCSAITCSHHVSNIPLKLWEHIIAAGSRQNAQFSTMEWPINGGTSLAPPPPQRDLLLTGHEDGTVRFWDASGVCLRLLYKLSTARVFLTETDPSENLNAQGEDEWPPLRKVGSFDPYSDDPRLGIQKIFLCKYSGYLAVAGTAGQVLVLELNDEAAEHAVEEVEADLLQDQEGYRWKGHERLAARSGPVYFEPGFQPFVLVQCQPPAVVTSLALHSEWRLVAFGTSHGFGLFDHQQRRQVFVKCTLHPSDQLALEGPLSRVKSLKKSLRQSFRRMRRSRVSSRKRRPAGPPGEVSPGQAQGSHHLDHEALNPGHLGPPTSLQMQAANTKPERMGLQNMELAPVQRKIEARSAEDSFTGFVRTLYFADTYLRDSSRHCPSLWAGTNGGTVYAFSLRVPPADRRMDEPVRAEQAKEIQLMHRAPVVGILVLDGHSIPLPEPLEVAHDLSKSPDMQGSHQLLVVSEEQFKVFTLPKVSAKLKLKLTALEGSRVRRVGVAHFSSCRAEDYGEHHLAVLTNLGDIQVVSLPLLKPQVRYSCIRREDVSGIASCVFTKYGQGFYLISPSEFERFSLSTKWLVEPRCLVESARTKHHSRPSNGNGPGPDKSLGQTRVHLTCLCLPEKKPGPVMEHALLNDERESGWGLAEGRVRVSCGNWRSHRMAVGCSLGNGGAE